MQAGRHVGRHAGRQASRRLRAASVDVPSDTRGKMIPGSSAKEFREACAFKDKHAYLEDA